MKQIGIAIALILMFVGMFALQSAEATRLSTSPMWAQVQSSTSGLCKATEYIQPCPGCTVWIVWDTEPPPGFQYPMRLDGWVEDVGLCQYLHITYWRRCLPLGVD